MTGQWEKYVERATDALRNGGFVDPDDDTVPSYRGNDPIPVWVPAEEAAKALLSVIGPLIAEDTRVRMVEAAGRVLKRAGREDADQLGSCIWIDPGRQSGVACFGGTRVPVDPFMAIVEESDVENARALWPSVTEEHVAAGKLWRARYHEWGRGVR